MAGPVSPSNTHSTLSDSIVLVKHSDCTPSAEEFRLLGNVLERISTTALQALYQDMEEAHKKIIPEIEKQINAKEKNPSIMFQSIETHQSRFREALVNFPSQEERERLKPFWPPRIIPFTREEAHQFRIMCTKLGDQNVGWRIFPRDPHFAIYLPEKGSPIECLSMVKDSYRNTPPQSAPPSPTASDISSTVSTPILTAASGTSTPTTSKSPKGLDLSATAAQGLGLISIIEEQPSRTPQQEAAPQPQPPEESSTQLPTVSAPVISACPLNACFLNRIAAAVANLFKVSDHDRND